MPTHGLALDGDGGAPVAAGHDAGLEHRDRVVHILGDFPKVDMLCLLMVP